VADVPSEGGEDTPLSCCLIPSKTDSKGCYSVFIGYLATRVAYFTLEALREA